MRTQIARERRTLAKRPKSISGGDPNGPRSSEDESGNSSINNGHLIVGTTSGVTRFYGPACSVYLSVSDTGLDFVDEL